MTAPEGTTAHLIQSWGGMDADHYTRSDQRTRWHVQGTETTGDRAGSSLTEEAVYSLDEARALLAELRADPEMSRYDTWEIVRIESLARVSLEQIDPTGAGQ